MFEQKENEGAMSQDADPMQSPQRLRAHAIATLVPFFADGSAGDEQNARVAAAGLLNDYNAATPKELQLSTQIIALGWAAMACLRTAVAVCKAFAPVANWIPKPAAGAPLYLVSTR